MARAPRQILMPMVLPLLLGGFVGQAVVPLARVATSYQVLALGHGAEVIGLLSAAFAFLPILLAVALGRASDRGGSGRMALGGGVGIALACLLLWAGRQSLTVLFLGTALLGFGQIMLLSACQFLTARASTRAHRDAILGNYMVAISLGQAVGPLAMVLTEDTGLLLLLPLAGSVLLVGFCEVLRRRVRPRVTGDSAAALPLRAIAATRGLPWIILLGAVCITAQDLLLAFLPVLGVERGIAPAAIGLLLGLRAVAAMVSRLFFGQAVRAFGRLRLLVAAVSAGALALLSFATPLPLWTIAGAMLLTGLGFGLALTSTIAMTLSIAPAAARGTALSLRLTVNRVTQFAIPGLAGLAMVPLGAGGIFALSGLFLLGIVLCRPAGLPSR